MLVAALGQRLGFVAQALRGLVQRLLALALAFAQASHALQHALDLAHPHHPAAQVAVHGALTPLRLIAEIRQRLLGRLALGLGLGVPQALARHRDLGLAFAKALDGEQFVEHAHADPTMPVICANASGSVARSSVRCRRN